MRRLAPLVVVALLATGCLGSDFAASAEGAWELESGTYDGDPIPIVDSHPITMTLEDGQIGGTAACNSYGGQYRLSGNGFSLEGGLSVTEMACQPDEVMESEQRFLNALVSVGTVELGNARLVMRGENIELVFSLLPPVPTSELTGTLWVLNGLVHGDAVSSPISSAETATLELFDDGSFAGSTGCRTISGTYQITGAEVQFTNWGAEGECPDELSEQDGRVISALEGGFRIEIDGDRMTTWVAGDEGLLYRVGR